MSLRRLVNLRGVRLDDHAFGGDERARGLQLGHLFHFDQAHAAGGLQRKTRVVAERRDLDALFFGRFDHQRAGGRGDLPAVERERDCFLFRHAFVLARLASNHLGAVLYAHFPWR